MTRLANHLVDRKTAMSVAEIAEILQVSERQIYKMVEEDQIPSFKVGGVIRFDPHVFGGWLTRAVNGGEQRVLEHFTPKMQNAAWEKFDSLVTRKAKAANKEA